MKEIQEVINLKAQLDLLRPIDKEQEARIMQKFRLDWNYHSNHLEGNSLTYGETKALLLFGVTAQGKPLKDTLEITGHNEAINWVLEMIAGERPLTENFIRELHSLLLQDSYKNSKNSDGKTVPRKITSGKYKTTPNHVETVTGEVFYFASPEETPAKMYDLLNWYKEKTEDREVNPLLVAAEFHYKFIRIHPFDDGNGRVARILMNFILMQFGFPPVIIKTEDKDNYFAALQLADAGNIEPFINYIATNLNRSLEIMIAGANGESIEEDDDLDKEIALLEQRLNQHNAKNVDTKTAKEILKIYNNSLIKIIYSLREKSKLFNKFYDDFVIKYIVISEVEYFRSFKKSSKINYIKPIEFTDFDDARKRITNETYIIKINFFFNSFNREGFSGFNYLSQFQFEFKEKNYNIIIPKGMIISKPYDLELTDSEIDEIVKSEVKRHKDFIEQKIAEKEKNNQ